MTKTQIREALIKNGVKNLKEFGYPTVNEKNILTDPVYRAFFRGMLEAEENRHPAMEEVRVELLKETAPPPQAKPKRAKAPK